jgi:hypothetical protein
VQVSAHLEVTEHPMPLDAGLVCIVVLSEKNYAPSEERRSTFDSAEEPSSD